ncbi:glycosyl transferase family 2 [Amycolatopsis antarctica]|uniref:Glycosyl transferase family 2 n=1 Tax=Amycolatopsis antarctica TaxID=1854586 RepID=A0A263CZ05_9PSEU|nr:glycosyltransferase family A protein [Amycolatopsis antarctica]OZM70335.1 glycosyl transferase family 2 [Amycolatopsis antarctica]
MSGPGSATATWALADWPGVSVVIPTRDRPELLARAVRGVLEQEYPGDIECIVVFDRSEPQDVPVPVTGPHRTLRVTGNERTPGLAGARNTGILLAAHEVVGHCDDDDVWLAGKLTRQLELWRRSADAPVVATGVTIHSETGEHRRPAPERASFAEFLESRIMEIHSSTLLVRKADLLGRIGLLDEELPNSFGEDYDWLLRAARHGDVVSVPEPLIAVNWSRPSFYMSKWKAMADGLTYILRKFPEFAGTRTGRARLEGQIAFAHAARGARGQAVRWAVRTLRHDPRQLRAFGALAVAARLTSADGLVRRVQARGRGL